MVLPTVNNKFFCYLSCWQGCQPCHSNDSPKGKRILIVKDIIVPSWFLTIQFKIRKDFGLFSASRCFLRGRRQGKTFVPI